MNPKAYLQFMQSQDFQFEGGEIFSIALKPGLNPSELSDFEAKLPAKLPEPIRELLLFTRGFTFDVLRDVNFDDINSFDLQSIFNCPIKLCDDEIGNVWVLDVKKDGTWGNVFFISKQPPVIVKETENLTDFLKYIYEFGKDFQNSQLHKTKNETVYDIWSNDDDFIKVEEIKNLDDTKIRAFAKNLRPDSQIYDFRQAPNGKGFSWAKFGNETEVLRYQNENLFAVQKKLKTKLWDKVIIVLNLFQKSLKNTFKI
jgi:hypothetical protein